MTVGAQARERLDALDPLDETLDVREHLRDAESDAPCPPCGDDGEGGDGGDCAGPGRFRRWVLRPIAWSLAAVAVLIFLLQLLADTPRAREWTRAWLESELEDVLARDVELRAVEVELLPFALHVRDLRIGGVAGGVTAASRSRIEPFLVVPYGLIEADLDALRDRRVHLHRLRLERPEVYLHFWGTGDNLLAPRGAGGEWEVRIDQIEIVKARLALDQEAIRVSLDGETVRARLRGLGDRAVEGEVSLQSVDVDLPYADRPVRVAASTEIAIDGDGLRLTNGSWSADRGSGQLDGECAFRGPDRKCVLATRGRIDARILDDIGWFRDLESRITVDGAFTWRPGSTGWRGELTAAEASLWDRQLEDVRGVLGADKFGLRLDLERALYAGGRLDGTVHAALREPTKPLEVDLRFDGVELDALLADQAIPVDGFAARAEGTVTYRAELNGERDDVGANARRGDGRALVQLTPDVDRLEAIDRSAAKPPLPVEGRIPIRITDGRLEVEAVGLRAERQGLLADGAYDLPTGRGAFDFEVETADVGELIDRLALQTGRSASVSIDDAWMPLDGRGTLAGTLVVGPEGTTADLRLQLEDVVTSSLRVERAGGTFRLDRDVLEDLQIDLGDADRALSIHGRLPLAGGAGATSLTVDTFGWRLDDLRPWLSFELPVEGDVTGRFEVRVPSAPQSTLSGQSTSTGQATDLPTGDLDVVVEPARVAGVAVDELDVDLSWRGQDLTIRRAVARTPAGDLAAAGSVTLPRLTEVLLASAGSLGSTTGDSTNDSTARVDLADATVDLRIRTDDAALDRPPLSDWLPRAALGGTLDARARLLGRLGAPDVDLQIDLPRLTLGGRRLEGSSNLAATWRDGRLDVEGRLLDAARVDGGGTLALAAGEVDWPATDLAIDLESDDLASLLRLVDRDLASLVDGHAHALLELDARGAALRVDRAALRLGDRELEPAAPLRVTLDRNGWRLEDAELVARQGAERIRLGGAGGWRPGDELALDVDASLDASWLEPLVTQVAARGPLRFEGRLGGSSSAPRLDGALSVDGAEIALPGLVESLRDVRGRVLLDGPLGGEGGIDGGIDGGLVARIAELSGDLGGGRVLVGGRVDLDRGRVALQIDGQGVTLADVDGWRVAGDADLNLRGTIHGIGDGGAGTGDAGTGDADTDELLVSGRVDVESLAYFDDLRFDLTQLLRDVLRGRRLEVATADEARSKVRLEVQIFGPDAVAVRNNLADLTGDADLLLRGTLAQPVLFGEVVLTPGGTLVWNGGEYTVERARMVFADPYRLVPEVDLVASTRVRDFDVTLALSGPLERIETSFSSEPPLPDVEVLRLLAGGEAYVEPSGSADPRATRLEQEEQGSSAATFLYGQAASVIGDRVNDLFGFDKFRIDPLTGTDGDGLSTARVTVGKRLRRDLFVTYSVDPSSTEAQRLQVEWRVNDSLTLVLTQNGDSTYSADARWESTF